MVAYRKRSYSSICDEVDTLFFLDVFLAKNLLAKNGNRGINRGIPITLTQTHIHTQKGDINGGKFYEGSGDDGDGWKQGLCRMD